MPKTVVEDSHQSLYPLAEDLQGELPPYPALFPKPVFIRISVREASPEADLYNYNFKEKWEKSVEEAGLPKKYDQYDMNGYRKDHRVKNIKFTSKFDPSASKDSAFGKDDFINRINKKV